MKSFLQPGVAAPLQVLRVLALSLMTVSTGMIGPAKALRGGYDGEREKVMFAQAQANLAPTCYNGNSKNVVFTQYWIPQEGTKDANDDGTVISLSGPKVKNLVDDCGNTIEKTDKNTFAKCVEEGTCKLRNGDLINLSIGDRHAPTFKVLDEAKFPYGEGAFGNALVPFVSVAANDLSKGTLLFVKELEGFKLPNNKVHNGCVRVDDNFSEDFSCHIDWMISTYPNEVKINPRVPEKAHVKVQSCKLLSYM